MAIAYDYETELALKAGHDREALADLVNRFTSLAWIIIHQRMSRRSDEDQEDMYQTIMMHLCRNIKTFKAKSAFKTWFTQVAYNIIADYYRKCQRNRLVFVEEIFYNGNEPAIGPEWYSIYYELLKICPQKHLDIIYDRVVNGYTFIDIAHRDNRNREAIRGQYRRAIVKLKRKIEPCL